MSTDLNTSEKEEREVERLIDKKQPPSRKHTNKRGPKMDNRRRRMDVDDPDLSSKDKDMSLNYKGYSSTKPSNVIFNNMTLSETSNEKSYYKDMNSHVAKYHGVLHQGHPSGPTNSVPESIDKRYFTKKHFDVLVASAKKLLDDSWFNHSWDNDKSDARFRAALDTAIYTAENSMFQSKIDSNTYNLLLARVIGINDDQFSETFVSKRASMIDNLKNVVRIASDLKDSNPKLALELLKNVNLIKKFAEQSPFFAQQEQQVAQQEQQVAQQEQQAAAPKLNMKEVKQQLDLIEKSKDSTDLVEALTKLMESVHTASSRISADAKLEELEDMTDEQILQLVKERKPEVESLKNLLKSYSDFSEISEEDVEKFVHGLNDLVQDFSKGVKTASTVRVSISTLLKVAGTSAEAGAALRPFLMIAKKKLDKKKSQKKQSQKKSEEDTKEAPVKGKKPPVKKAPPSKKPPVKKAPPSSKGRKLSFEITKSDLSW